ncbi:MAG: NUDIX domain-containing protein [candidate division WOR-3 bacterium]
MDRVEMGRPDGQEPRPFVLSVRAIVRDEQGRVLLLRRSTTNRTNTGVWEFPGGKIDPGERLDEALVREVKEECGLDVVPTRAVGAVQTEHAGLHVVHLIMETQLAGGEVSLSKEHDGHMWIDSGHVLRQQMLSEFEIFWRRFYGSDSV